MPFSGFQDLDPRFAAALQQMIAANRSISPFSGYRSPERQAELFQAAVQKYGSEEAARAHVAPPGHSFHNKRLAADLAYADEAARQWAHANAGKYNLLFPLTHEPWHIELAGARSGAPGQPGGVGTWTGAVSPEESEPGNLAGFLGDATQPNTKLLPRSGADLSAGKSNSYQMSAGGAGDTAQELPGGELSPLVLETQDVAVSPDVLAQPWETGAKRTYRSPQDLADIFFVKDVGKAEQLGRRV